MSNSLVAIIAPLTALMGAVLGILKYFDYKTRRDKIMLVRQAFEDVVKSLASDSEVERMSGAILLRRFFDQQTEVGIAGTPYCKEAIYVSAGILRGQVTGNFQKLLADGLSFAPGLVRADLQKTNLQFAYLGIRYVAGNTAEQVTTDLSYADFYRANLSQASLKKSKATGAVFYQACMHNTVLSGADLREANFFEADLHGARFAGALLEKANFASAKNLPDGIREKLDKDGFYTDKAPFQPPAQSAKAGPIRVFISKPGSLAYDQQQHLNAVQTGLEKEGFTMQTLERDDYPRFGSIGEIRRLISDCSGAMIFGFKQLEVRDGLWLSDFKKEKEVKDLCMSTPWNQIEAGMAATLGLPIFVVSQRGIAGGIFDESLVESESQIFRVFVEDSLNSTAYVKSFSEWCANVRERSLIN